MAAVSELNTIKISDLTRKSLSSDLEYQDYLVFNDFSMGSVSATMAVTMQALDSYFKVNVGHIGRSALSGDAYGVMPSIQATTLSAANFRSTAGAIFNNLTASTFSTNNLDLITISAHNIQVHETLTATTISAKNINVGTLSGNLQGNLIGSVDEESGTSHFNNVHINGDLRVYGSTVTTSASNLSVHDPIIEVAAGQTAPEVDFGILGNRGSAINSAVIYDESADTWAVVYTNDDATLSGSVDINSYSDFTAHGGVFVGISGAGQNITDLNATQLTDGNIPDGRISVTNVTQWQSSLSINGSQVGDISHYARSAVSGAPVMPVINTTTLSGGNIRANVIEGGSVSGTVVSGATVYTDSVYIGGDTSSNQLDHYAEGTFTPVVNIETGDVVYSAQEGYYTRIGNLLYINGKIELFSVSSPAGVFTIGGFPVAAANHTGGTGVGTIIGDNVSFNPPISDGVTPFPLQMNMRMIPNTSTAQIIFQDSRTGVEIGTGDCLRATSVFQFSIFYQV